MNVPKKLRLIDAAALPEWWFMGGALYGVTLRVLFGVMPASFGRPMSAAFLLGTPLVIGALTIFGFRDRNPTILFMCFAPWLTVSLMLLGCAATLLEGAICIAIMMPLFLVCATLGGVAMGLALRFSGIGRSQLAAVAVLPFFIALGESRLPMPDRHMELRQSVDIHAMPNTVWEQILVAQNIRAEELPFSLTHWIGVPKPLEGINVSTPEGEIRYSTWERGVHFRAVVTKRKENESITWRYLFDPDSFPPGSMDEHVAIGGRYFDLGDTTFNLHPLPGDRTRLEIIAHYRVTSSINFYAVPATILLGRDFIHAILGLYKERAEKYQRAES